MGHRHWAKTIRPQVYPHFGAERKVGELVGGETNWSGKFNPPTESPVLRIKEPDAFL